MPSSLWAITIMQLTKWIPSSRPLLEDYKMFYSDSCMAVTQLINVDWPNVGELPYEGNFNLPFTS